MYHVSCLLICGLLFFLQYLAQGNAGITIGALVQAVQKIDKDELEDEIRQLAGTTYLHCSQAGMCVCGSKYFM